MSNSRILKNIYASLDITLPQIRQIIRDFHSEMLRGLRGQKSSLKMIPTYLDRPNGKETGKFIALDLGGTNLRILGLELKGKGKILVSAEKRFILEKRYTKGSKEAFFDFIAECIKKFTEEYKISSTNAPRLGFTFSFPIEQTGVASGILLRWTKDFSVKEVEGREVVGLLRGSLIKRGLSNIKIAALVNDTVGTLVARAYTDADCDIGVILGTGTNACYREKISRVPKLNRCKSGAGHMIINIEWGNFNKLKLCPFDRELDTASVNPGEQVLEKMVSGMYLGEIARLILRDLSINLQGRFKTHYLSEIESDFSKGLSQTKKLLTQLGIKNSSIEERMLIRNICRVVSRRAALICAAVLAAVVIKIDRNLAKKHTIAIDGSLYEKHPGYALIIESTLKKIFGRKYSNIKLVLTKDGSGIGAAIAVAASLK